MIDENLPTRLTAYLRAEGYEAEHAYDVGLRTRPDPDMFAYAQAATATLITQDHDLERDYSGKAGVEWLPSEQQGEGRQQRCALLLERGAVPANPPEGVRARV